MKTPLLFFALSFPPLSLSVCFCLNFIFFLLFLFAFVLVFVLAAAAARKKKKKGGEKRGKCMCGIVLLLLLLLTPVGCCCCFFFPFVRSFVIILFCFPSSQEWTVFVSPSPSFSLPLFIRFPSSFLLLSPLNSFLL